MFERKDCELKPVRLRLTRTADGALFEADGTPWSLATASAYWLAGHRVAINGQVYPPPGQIARLDKKRGSRL